ncbi:unnamed protein product [Paramecium sonneborni]|uniref:Transmembrane protein n=1 Tax=Paramecium sonneborni TaxID=65129 RepID=A0A8S1RA01_9CILI|nr:unnamed protein product [Paramecium sonneborni]
MLVDKWKRENPITQTIINFLEDGYLRKNLYDRNSLQSLRKWKGSRIILVEILKIVYSMEIQPQISLIKKIKEIIQQKGIQKTKDLLNQRRKISNQFIMVSCQNKSSKSQQFKYHKGIINLNFQESNIIKRLYFFVGRLNLCTYSYFFVKFLILYSSKLLQNMSNKILIKI